MRTCIVFNCHVMSDPVCTLFERLQREAPANADVYFLLISETPSELAARVPDGRLVRVTHADIISPAYTLKCQTDHWQMAGNLDLAFLAFRRQCPEYDAYWFVEYDVHWEGRWSVLFDHFATSPADLLATTITRLDAVPHKGAQLDYPVLAIPPALGWAEADCLKAFLPLCRFSSAALDALHDAYQRGLGGHYELTAPSVAAAAGLTVEDIGGDGPFVKAENRDRFYFAQPGTSSHSPGTFVFRPSPQVLRRPHTLWHPVKPAGVPVWHPLRVRGNPAKTALELSKPLIWRALIWVWFATKWRPLRIRA